MSLSTGASTKSLRYGISPLVKETHAPPIPIARAWATAYASNPTHGPLVDLSQGVPGTAPHQSVLEGISKLALDPSIAKYGPILGEPSLRDALTVELQQLYGCSISKANGTSESDGLDESGLTSADVAITTGCNMAMMAVIMSLCPAGSGVLLPAPAYFNYEMAMSMQGVKPIWLPSDPDEAFVPSIEYARLYLDAARKAREEGRGEAGPTPKMIMLTTPHNPTGTIMPTETLRKWYDLAKEFEVALVLDETYRDFVVADAGNAGDAQGGGRVEPHKLFDIPDWRGTLISLGSFSKSYRIPGYRLGSITAHPALLDQVLTICDCMQICAPRLPQLALAPLLPSLRPDLLSSSQSLTQLRSLFHDIIASLPGWSIAASGAYFAYVSFPEEYVYASSSIGLKRPSLGSMDVAKALATRFGVVCLPGAFFQPDLDEVDVRQGQVLQSQGLGQSESRDWWGKLRKDRWLRFAVANVDEDTIKALGPRLRAMNRLMGMDDEA